jgi:hypothetical protein
MEIPQDQSQLKKFDYLKTKQSLIDALVISICFSAFVGIWFFFDHHFPAHDEAGHIMNSMAFRDLLLKFRPWKLYWWHECLVVNRFYPPAVYVFWGFMMLCFGTNRFTEVLSVLAYTFVLSSSVYAITRLLHFGRLAAISSAIIINLYPGVAQLNHSFMLDLPLLSMISLALASLLWWRANPSWLRALITGIIVAISCLSKQLAAVFLAPASAFLLVSTLLCHKEHRIKLSAQLLLIALIVVILCLPFVLTNYQFIMEQSQEKITAITSTGAHPSFAHNLAAYLSFFWSLISPLWFIVFGWALIRLSLRDHRQLAPLTISTIGGLCLLSLWSADLPFARYSACGLVAPAVYSGTAIELVLISGNRLKNICISGVWLAGIVQYILCCFCPYPINLPSLTILPAIGLTSASPQKLENWGLEDTIKAIKSIDGEERVCLNVFTNSAQLNAHTFQFAVKEFNAENIQPTTSRIWTIMGDKVYFDPKTVLFCEWCLLEPTNPGYYFLNQQSQDNYIKLENLVRNYGRFRLIRQQSLPDGNRLYLYRKI